MSEPESAPGHVAEPAKAAQPLWMWIVATLAMPLALALIGYAFTSQQAKHDAADRDAVDKRSSRDAKLRTFTELLFKREEADMGVRKEIFSTLLGNYFDRDNGATAKAADATVAGMTRRMTVLELLASNFDESLSLSPLFWQLDRDLAAVAEAPRRALHDRLSGLADEVKRRQIDALSASGGEREKLLYFNHPDELGVPLFNAPILFTDPAGSTDAKAHGCKFEVSPLEYDAVGHRIYVEVQTEALSDAASTNDSCLSADQHGPRQWSFWVDEFDFPLITYTRMSTTERFSVVMTGYHPADGYVTVSLVYFPSSRSGARDRPFLDTVVDALTADPDRASPPTAGASR